MVNAPCKPAFPDKILEFGKVILQLFPFNIVYIQ